ncbi:unnamed protein product [Paramecium sonneborni]|uniref:Uncharacterized protein n=1 Tax=Paramecium sonneborni TaxID=65129 RepID=A0A8S1NHE5_9CILI|nr:unnamed protein product [Paramecium sonneborni]
MAEQGRYSKLSEEEAAAQFELRKQQLLGNLQEQYQNANSQKNKKQSKSQQQQSNKQEFIVFNPTKKQSSQSSKNPIKKLQFLKEESHLQTPPPEQPEQEIEYQVQQPVDPIPPEQSPLIEKPQKPSIKKMLLRDIGNLDLEIQRLTRETKDFQNEKQLNKSQLSQQPKNLKESLTKQLPRPSSSQQQQQSKAYYELRQRPSSKESRISDASYTKKAECFKGVIRSSSLKKLPQPSKTNYNFLQLRSASEKRINQSINKTNTVESENKDITQKIAQSERKIPKPMIQMNRSQSKQDTPTYEKKSSTPVKSILKVQFNSIPVECSSTKNNSSSYFHQHKESYNSQISFSKNKCVEAQIEEAVQLYNNLKSLMQNKTSVLQARKDGNLIPRKTADFFYHKEIQKPTLY